MTDRIRITDPDPVIESMLAKMDAKVNRPIVAPDGRTLFEPLVDDRTLTYAKDGQSYSIEWQELLMRAARMQRDGKSLKAIKAELDLVNVSDRLLEGALKMGHMLLADAIASGAEPEESVRVVGYREVEEDDTNEATVEDALALGRTLAEDWVK